MANSLKSLATVELTTSFATVYTVPVATQFTVGMIHISNTTNSAKTIRLCRVPSAGSPTATNALLWDFSIPANDFVEFLKGDIFPASTTLQGLANANSAVTITVSGIETT